VEHITISDQDEEFADGEDEFDSFEDYRDYVLEEAAAVYEQGFSKVVIMTKQEYQAKAINNLVKDMKRIFVLIMLTEDGMSFRLSSNLELMKKKFEQEKDNMFNVRVTLAEVEEDAEIGYGAQGCFFGGEVILEWEN
jgi:hypothetical protein